MHSLHLAVLLTGLFTWVGMTLVARRYFRHASRRTPAKDWLIVSAFVCTLAQLVTIARVSPPNPLCAWVGIGLYGLAVLLFVWSLLTHGQTRPAFVGVDVGPASFQHRGPYRVVRHPIYTAYLLAWLPGPVVTLQWWLLLTFVWMGWVYYRAARREEEHFASSTFAPQYGEYRQRTGMFLPKVIPLGKGVNPTAKAG
jgi:protein-S-isoprenylcysteine O-methyltransferase Ste14